MSRSAELRSKGFTLIELVLVILVVSILSGVIISVVNIPLQQQQGRDKQRIGDLGKIKSALEIYYTDNNQYPNLGNGWWTTTSGLSASLTPDYLTTVPDDPSSTGSDICNGDRNYYYATDSTASNYSLATIMEAAQSNALSPCTNTGCTTPPTNCYVASSPLGAVPTPNLGGAGSSTCSSLGGTCSVSSCTELPGANDCLWTKCISSCVNAQNCSYLATGSICLLPDGLGSQGLCNGMGSCVECISTGDCPSGQICTGNNVCVNPLPPPPPCGGSYEQCCTTTPICDPPLSCASGVCV